MILITEQEILNNPNDQSLGEFIRKKYQEIKNTNDVCVECGDKTPYTIHTPIDQRIGYIEGSGQGCFQPDKCSKFI